MYEASIVLLEWVVLGLGLQAPDIWFISNDESSFESRQEKSTDWKDSFMRWSSITVLSCRPLPSLASC